MDPIVLVLIALALIIVGVLFFLNKNKKSILSTLISDLLEIHFFVVFIIAKEEDENAPNRPQRNLNPAALQRNRLQRARLRNRNRNRGMIRLYFGFYLNFISYNVI